MSNIAIDRSPTEGGFTLIELLVVLTIIALLSAVAASSFFKQGPWQGRQELAFFLDAAAAARIKAMRTGQATNIEASAIPDGARFTTVNGDTPRWYADGTALPATLSRNNDILVRIDPMTGLAAEAP